MNLLLFLPIGFFVGAYGTLIGAGGGFLLVPLFLFLSPSDSPAMVTAGSLAIIFANAVSGTVAYAWQRRISYRTGILFALATIPGAVLGSYLNGFIPRRVFGIAFGGLLIAVAVFLTVSRGRKKPGGETVGERGAAEEAAKAAAPAPGRPAVDQTSSTARQIVDTVIDRDGNRYVLSYNIWLGMGLSLLIGLFSSVVGIGGGLIHVPVLTYLFGFPIHVATATSHFVLVFTALAGVITHIVDGTFPGDIPRLVVLAAGVVAGAQLSALLSRRVSARWIVIGLAAALGLVGVRLLIQAA